MEHLSCHPHSLGHNLHWLLKKGNICVIVVRIQHGCYTPLQKKCYTWFRSPHDLSLGSATPRGQKVISRGSSPDFEPFNKFLPLWGR